MRRRRAKLTGVAEEDHRYIIALGSNQRHPAFGSPREVVATAMELLDGTAGTVARCSRIMDSAPVGPSQRRFANAAVLLETRLNPLSLLMVLQEAEAVMGRRKRGQRWRARVLDLDIVLWSGGRVTEKDLFVPHPLFRGRHFVLWPAAQVAPHWRDPYTGLTLRQLAARL